ncbi:MAG TPA: hypothetical protein VFV50_11395 [Bdellovibrionales bacterium]|nr:hypothetical protein [Bdellovibrionales bacterium]
MIPGLSRLLFVLLAAIQIACTTTADRPQAAISDKEYVELVEKHTKGKKLYDGFNLAFEYHATLLTTELQNAQVEVEATDFQWTREKAQTERDKIQTSAAKETQIFLSFFTPENENDNLETTGSLWRIYLVTGGMKYEGKAIRTGGLLADLQRKYPHHTRFSTPYLVTFNVPLNLIQGSDIQFVLTGTVGTSEVPFKP